MRCFGAFRRSLGEQDLSPVTARGYLHDLGKFRGWLEGEAGAQPRDLRRVGYYTRPWRVCPAARSSDCTSVSVNPKRNYALIKVFGLAA